MSGGFDYARSRRALVASISAKRSFKWEGDSYEIDAASPIITGADIRYAIDIKRIEARRDIHKRSDEIVNKAVAYVRG